MFKAGVVLLFPALLVAVDLLASFFCDAVPLWCYLAATALGAMIAPQLEKKIRGAMRAPLQLLVGATVVTATFGALWRATLTPSWNEKCAHRYCARLLGPGLDRSPYPVDPGVCGPLYICANEASFSDDEYQELLTILRKRGCDEP